MNIRTILGLTATAPKSTVCSIAQHLGVDPSAGIFFFTETRNHIKTLIFFVCLGVIRGTLLPLNLQLSVSRDADRDAALLQLLQSGRFADYDSIIIYCIRREECERLATLLRTCLKDPIRDMASKGGHSRRKGISWSAESYHAGLVSLLNLIASLFPVNKFELLFPFRPQLAGLRFKNNLCPAN